MILTLVAFALNIVHLTTFSKISLFWTLLPFSYNAELSFTGRILIHSCSFSLATLYFVGYMSYHQDSYKSTCIWPCQRLDNYGPISLFFYVLSLSF